MRVFITGATGFIGAHVVRAHLAEGWQVRCLVRASSPGTTLAGLPVERVQASLSDPQQLGSALRGCDAIQHVAGIYDTSPGGAERMHHIHVQVTRALCEAALEQGIERLVYCSSSVTIGWGSLARPADEDSPPPDPDSAFGRGTALRAYHDSKLAGERAIQRAARRGLHAVTVNPDYVVGPWDLKPTSGAMILAQGRRWVPIYPRGGKCFIDAADCGLGHLRALERGRPGERYLLGVHNLSYRDFMARVARVVGRPRPLLPLPRRATRAIGRLGGALVHLGVEQAAVLDPYLLRSMQQQRYRDGGRASREFDLPRTPIDQSIEAAWRWFRDHGYA